MNSQEYWKKRALLAKQKEMASTAEYEVAMRSRLKDLENEFIRESKKWVTKYAKENNQSLRQAADYLNSIDTTKFDITLAEFEAKARAGGFEKELNSAYYKTRIARLQELYRQYQELAARYADNEEDNMAIGLAKRYEDTYLLENYNKYLVVGGLDVNFAHFNEQELKDIVYQPWKGGNFSKRIWNNYTKVMPEVLTDVMFRSTALGYSYNRVERMLRDRFQGMVKSNIHRLVVTEMGHAAEQATAKFYKDSDIDQYQYLATLETHTCEVCAHLDGRIFYVKDEKDGVNYPLIHPYCRCSTVPAVDWESYQNASWGNSNYVRQFVDEYHNLSGVWPLIYVQESAINQVANCAKDCGLWVAKYPSMDWKSWNVPNMKVNTIPWSTYTIWQFTGDNMDRNLVNTTRDGWKKLAKGSKSKIEKKSSWVKKSGTFTLAEDLHLHESPHIDSPSIALLKKGDTVKFDATLQGPKRLWLRQPRANGTYGYIVARDKYNNPLGKIN